MRNLLIKFFLISVLVFAWTTANANDVKYRNATISLITCTGGSELYSTFGHSALRVKDDSLSMDVIFNFGLFDFATPNFYLKFMQGKLNYMLGVQNTEDFLWQYDYEGRGVVEQIIDLTQEQKNEIMERLIYLYRPENRYYLYSFLFKNCTTELRDILENYVELPTGTEDKNFRELINGYVRESKWTRAGINLILGSNLDRVISLREGMFLPDKLFDGLSESADFKELMPRKETSVSKPTNFFISPLFISIIIFLLTVASRFIRVLRPVQDIVLVLSALLGLVLTGIIIMTDHIELHANYNLLWCNPIYALLLVTLPFVKRCGKLARVLIIILLVLSLTIAVIWLNGIQGYLPEYVLIVASQFAMLGGIRERVNEKTV
ncbi:MAG: hypothetical protein BGO30_05500 [Bacteroidetes bacterium 41-46]|nr:MAG: hypothetical protein BGO30_05500 [Bacteroidetes bacterium 41-46]